MNNQTSFLWGVLSSFLGGFIVAILLYVLAVKPQKGSPLWFTAGFFFVVFLLFAVLGTVSLFGLLGGLAGA